MKVNLETAVQQYMAHLDAMGYKDSTMHASIIVLRRLVQMHGGNRQLTSITDHTIDRFMAAEAKTRRGAGLRQSHNRLRAFYTWCEKTGRVKTTQNPMGIRRAPRVAEREQQRLSVDKFPLLLRIAGERHPRDRALVAVGIYTMLRDGEMKTLRIRDLDLNGGTLYSMVHKSNIVDRLAVSSELDTEMRAWLRFYQDAAGPLQPDWLLLPTLRTDAATPRAADGTFQAGFDLVPSPTRPIGNTAQRLRPMLIEAGLSPTRDDGTRDRPGAHTLRRSGARALYDALVARGRADALRVVQTQLHHKSAVQTAHYIGLSEDRVTRDDLIRGVSMFGYEELPQIGGLDDAPSPGGLRRVWEA